MIKLRAMIGGSLSSFADFENTGHNCPVKVEKLVKIGIWKTDNLLELCLANITGHIRGILVTDSTVHFGSSQRSQRLGTVGALVI